MLEDDTECCICSVVCVPTVMSTAIRQHMLFCIVDFIAACVATLHPPCEREPGRKGHNTSHNRQAGVLRFLPRALPAVTESGIVYHSHANAALHLVDDSS